MFASVMMAEQYYKSSFGVQNKNRLMDQALQFLCCCNFYVLSLLW